MVSSRYRTLTVAACAGMLLVLLAGALVTNTESGRGCGDDWPLCNGKFIPAYTLESIIEYSHRAISGLVGLLVLILFLVTIRFYRQSKEAVLYTGSVLLFTVVQALLGAAAVMWPQSPPVMALHFGISLLAFAGTLLIVMWAYRNKKRPEEQIRQEVPHSVYKLSWLAFAYTYVIVYIGAFIRHTDSSGGCVGWPLCNGEVVPEISGATGIVFIHRVAAFILALGMFALMRHIYRATDHEGIRRSSRITVILVAVQIFSGALLTLTVTNENVFIFTSLLHNLIIAGFFGLLADLCIRSWIDRKGRDNE